MRAIWKGAVSFGLVSVPVKLYSATESHDISFRQVHAKDGGRIKYQRVCSVDGEEVAYADIAKGFETEDGQMVILDDQDFAELPTTSSREISVEKFVPSDQIDPLMLEKSYYLEPEKSGLKPYALLRDALRASDRVAVVTVALRSRTSPAVLRVRDEVLVLQTLMWPDEVRTPAFGSLQDVEEPKPQELKMAKLLLETLAGDYDPSELEDDYAEAVHALVEAKLAGGEVKQTKEPAPSAGEVVDLLAALQRSVAAAKTARGEPADEAPAETGDPASETSTDEPSEKPPAKRATRKKKDAPEEDAAPRKSTAKKAAPKKAAPKKATAKKTAEAKQPARKSA
jgi:DNA end-binding protein Ku